MIDHGRKNVLGVLVDALDYDAALERILSAARERRGLAASALAVHGVMTGVHDRAHRSRLNELDLVTPDGQPVRWALNWLHGTRLTHRVYGPELMLRVCRAAAAEQLPVYLYGSSAEVLETLRARLTQEFPGVEIVGAEPSRFRSLSAPERDELCGRIVSSGARIVLVGLGCPRQEVFVHEMRPDVPAALIAVGAAFDYHAGLLSQPPQWIQDRGLQWLYRLVQDPARLWRRYLLLNPDFLVRLAAQWLGLWRPTPLVGAAEGELLRHG